MSDYGTLSASVRTLNGKGASRTLRSQGLIPAVLYGRGQGSVSLTIDPLAFRKATDPTRNWNTLFKLSIQEDGQPVRVEPCIVADLQRDSVRRDVIHIDFLRVDPTQEIVRKVPVSYAGRSIGVFKGGKMRTFRKVTTVAALPENFPVELVVDITNVDGGQSLCIKDMTLPNARFTENPNQTLVFVAMPKEKKAEDEAAAAAEAGKKKK